MSRQFQHGAASLHPSTEPGAGYGGPEWDGCIETPPEVSLVAVSRLFRY